MSIPAIGGALLGLAGPIAGAAAGIGRTNTVAKTFASTQGKPGGFDPNASQYGGVQGGANTAAAQYGGLAAGAQYRNAPHAANVGVDYQGNGYGSANSYAQAGDAASGGAGQAAGMMMQRAQGLVPSIAQMQADRQMQQATAAQASAGASARGAGGLALAGQNAANNTATMQSAISNQAQINGAQEQQQNTQNAYNAYSGIRGADQASQAQAAQQAQYSAQLGAQQNQYNAGLQMQSQNANDQYSMGLYGLQNNVQQAQLNANAQQQNMLAGNFQNSTNQNIGIAQTNSAVDAGYYQQGMKALGGGADAQTQTGLAQQAPSASGSGGTPPLEQYRANGGPVSAGRPYVVGERGPELVVPPRDGYVLPAEHPASRMAAMSDDRAKFGISPLGLLGLGGGSGGGSGWADGGGGIPTASGPAYAMSGGGLDPAGTMRAINQQTVLGPMSNPGGDPTGGMQGGGFGGLLSDDRAKRAVYLQGLSHGAERARGRGQDVPFTYPLPGSGEELVEGSSGEPEIRSLSRGPAPMSASGAPGFWSGGLLAGAEAQMPAWARQQQQIQASTGASPEMAQRAAEYMARTQNPFVGAQAQGQGSTDPITDQFAQGLAPIRFEYKPGMGPPGAQTGVRAQAAAAQPVTSSMINQRGDGLLEIDPRMGLSTALAGVGHLAKKQQEQNRKLDGLYAAAAQSDGYR